MFRKKIMALGLAGAMIVTTALTGCGSNSSSSDESSTDFTWLLSAGVDTQFASEYEDIPAAQYWMSQEWDVDGEATTINVDFVTPPSGSEKDNFNTLLATGEYPDVMNIDYASETPSALYDEGIVIDLTDYVDQYMPNYKAWLEENPELAEQMKYDGKILTLYFVVDQAEDAWSGFMYRRDWIVKYGTNPETGEGFTGGYTDDTKGEWIDDVVFPSGNTDPVYISDWEWMFEIFETALKEEGITDGYAVQNYYAGFYSPDELVSGFGGNGMNAYVDANGQVQFGATEDGTRAFIQCMNKWYEEGWMDQAFEERSSDNVWFSIDTASVYSGKVGMWYGLTSQVGSNLDSGDSITSGICVFGAANPINDVYGDESCQNIIPTTFYQGAVVSSGAVVTNKAEEKNIGALLTAIDYLYSKDGALIRSFGLNKDQLDEIGGSELYDQANMSETGAYEITTDEEGNEVIVKNTGADGIDGLYEALVLGRLPGLGIHKNVDSGNNAITQHFIALQSEYTATGNVTSLTSTALTSEQSDEQSVIFNNIFTYECQAVPDFVTGRADIDDDAAWQEFCDEIVELGSERYIEIYREAGK